MLYSQFYPQITRVSGDAIWFWSYNVEDPAMYKPGRYEQDNIGNADVATRTRDRHVILAWAPLKALLQRIGAADRKLDAYRQAVADRQTQIKLLPGGIVEQVV